MSLLDLLFPIVCARCGTVGASPCARCLAALHPPPHLATPLGVESLLALTAYDEASGVFITAAKYGNARPALGALGQILADELGDEVRASVELITWAPTTPARRRARGFDQAQIIATALGRRLGRPVRRTLRRSGPGAQTGRSREERLTGPRFTARSVSGPVLIVDDVCTTGATLRAAAAALRAAGCPQVHAAVIARTPMHRRGSGRAA